MKKSIGFLLTITLLLAFCLTPSYAHGNKHFVPPGLAKKGGLPPGISKKFKDIERYEWAKKAIEKMLSKGVIHGINENEFAPSRSVTKVESLVMILRTMGWGDQADSHLDLIKHGKKRDKLKNKVQDWGKGYIDLALEKGIIDEVDLWQHNFTEPATRQEVAKYIIRALGYKDQSEDYMDKELRFKDASAVQIGNVGYIYLMDKKEIMTGYPDGTFRPNQPVKRVEMAALVANLDDKLNNEEKEDVVEKEVFEGNITAIDLDDKEIVVKIDHKEKLFKIEKDTVIKINGKEEDFEDLYKKMTVKIIVEEDSVVRIYAEDEEDEFEGSILHVYSEKLKIKVGTIEKTFEVDEDAYIKLDKEHVQLDELEKGMSVELKVENGKAIKIYAESIDKKYEGKIVEKVEADVNKLTIIIDGENKTFALDERVSIEEDDYEVKFENLEVGSEVEITVVNNVILKIEIED